MLCALVSACSKYPKVQVEQVSGIEFVQVGADGFVYAIDDNADEKKHPASLFDAPDSLIEALGLQEGVESSVRSYLIKAQDKYVLVDVGLGEKANGQLLNKMQELGISPDDIDFVLITHMHGDHIGGLLKDGEPVFRNAELEISADELSFWEEGENPQQQAVLDVYSERLVAFNPGDLMPCGIEAVALPGHTPGHVGFRFEKVMIIGDVIHGWDLQAAYPDYCARFDMDKEQSVATRKAVLEQCRKENLLIAGMHLKNSFEK